MVETEFDIEFLHVERLLRPDTTGGTPEHTRITSGSLLQGTVCLRFLQEKLGCPCANAVGYVHALGVDRVEFVLLRPDEFVGVAAELTADLQFRREGHHELQPLLLVLLHRLYGFLNFLHFDVSGNHTSDDGGRRDDSLDSQGQHRVARVAYRKLRDGNG